MKRSNPHPDPAELEALRSGEASEETAAHVASCESCREGQDFGAELHERLREPDALVPSALDQDLRAQLASEAARVRGGKRRPRLALALAAAASLLLVVSGVTLRQHAPPPAAELAASDAAAMHGDLTRDGRLDVLDAFALARALESGADTPRDWDFNRDGRIDREDVSALADAAVSLEASS